MADNDGRPVEVDVEIRDQASAVLQQIAREIDRVTNKLVETGKKGTEAFEKVRRGSESAGQAGKKSNEEIFSLGRSLTDMGKVLAGPVTIAGLLYATGRSISNFSKEGAALHMLKADLGITAQQISIFQQALRQKGVADEGARKQIISSFFSQLKDLKAMGVYADIWDKLQGFNDPQFKRELLTLTEQGKIWESGLTVFKKYDELMKAGRPETARRLAHEFGMSPGEMEDMGHLLTTLKGNFQANEEEELKWLRTQEEVTSKARDLWARTAAGIRHMLLQIELDHKTFGIDENLGRKIDELLGTGTGGPGSGATGPTRRDRTVPEKHIGAEELLERARRFYLPGKQGSVEDEGALPRGATPTSYSANALRDVAEADRESNRTLKSIRDTLEDMDEAADDWGAATGGGAGRGLRFRRGIGPGGGVEGDRPGAGTTGGHMGAQPGAIVHGRRVADPTLFAKPGDVLYDPLTAEYLGGGVGGHSARFGAGHHEGVDVMARVGTPVYAVKPGTVVKGATGRGWDQSVIIDHGDGTYTRYLHQGKGVPEGTTVKGGEIVSHSGYRNAAHTHVEYWLGYPSARGSQLFNPRAVHGWGPKNLPQGGRRTIVPPAGGAPAGAPSGPTATPGPQSSVPGDATLVSGRASVFNDRTLAYGHDPNEPGFATYTHAGKGQLFIVRDPSGKEIIARKTDFGPSPWTGRKIDINKALAAKFGYTMGNFPTDKGQWQILPLDRGAIDRMLSSQIPAPAYPANANVTVDFGELAKEQMGSKPFLPLKNSSQRLGASVNEGAVRAGDESYSVWGGD